MKFSESHVEDAALEWLSGLGYAVLHGPNISPDSPTTRAPQLRPSAADRAPLRSARTSQPAPSRRNAGGCAA